MRCSEALSWLHQGFNATLSTRRSRGITALRACRMRQGHFFTRAQHTAGTAALRLMMALSPLSQF